MKEYKVTIELLSDTLLGSGESVPGVIDNDVKYDDYGLPYMSGKTLKGHIREQMELVVKFSNKNYQAEYVPFLLGASSSESDKELGRLRFSDVALPEDLRQAVAKAIKNRQVNATEILNALTVTNTSTRIDRETGTAADKSMRRERLIKTGMKFESVLYFDDSGVENNQKYFELIEDSFRALKHIGTHKSKGKGNIACSIKEVSQNEKG